MTGVAHHLQLGIGPSLRQVICAGGGANHIVAALHNHAGDMGNAVHMRKDLAICMQEAKNQGISLPLSALVDQFYSEVQAMGGSRWDTSSLAARLQARKRP